jgi:AcrR family transcriptional regulator
LRNNNTMTHVFSLSQHPATEAKRDTRTAILQVATRLVALHGCHGIGMRELAKEVGVTQSVMYHYFADKDELLLEMYLYANTELGRERFALEQLGSTEARLRQLIYFQLEHAELIAAVLRYYLYKRDVFHQLGTGALPEKATLHVEEVLQRGIDQGDISTVDIPAEAKVIAHSINGYILEYYPYMPSGKAVEVLVEGMVRFMMRSLTVRSKK